MSKTRKPYKARLIKGISKKAVYRYEIVYGNVQVYRESLHSRAHTLTDMLNTAYAMGYENGQSDLSTKIIKILSE